MQIPQWFTEKLIDTDAKALGVYLTLIRAKREIGWYSEYPEHIIREVRKELLRILNNKEELNEAFEASVEFLRLLHEFESMRLLIDKSILDSIENKYSELFKKIRNKYIKK